MQEEVLDPHGGGSTVTGCRADGIGMEDRAVDMALSRSDRTVMPKGVWDPELEGRLSKHGSAKRGLQRTRSRVGEPERWDRIGEGPRLVAWSYNTACRRVRALLDALTEGSEPRSGCPKDMGLVDRVWL